VSTCLKLKVTIDLFFAGGNPVNVEVNRTQRFSDHERVRVGAQWLAHDPPSSYPPRVSAFRVSGPNSVRPADGPVSVNSLKCSQRPFTAHLRTWLPFMHWSVCPHSCRSRARAANAGLPPRATQIPLDTQLKFLYIVSYLLLVERRRKRTGEWWGEGSGMSCLLPQQGGGGGYRCPRPRFPRATRHRPGPEGSRTAQRVRFVSGSNTKTPRSWSGERREGRQARVKLFDQQEH
jgi:hypothetical protein